MLADRQRDTQRDWPQYAARLPEPIFIQCLHRKQKTALFSGVRGGGATTEFFVHWQNDQQSGGSFNVVITVNRRDTAGVTWSPTWMLTQLLPMSPAYLPTRWHRHTAAAGSITQSRHCARGECVHPVWRLDNAVAMTTPAINATAQPAPASLNRAVAPGNCVWRYMPQVVVRSRLITHKRTHLRSTPDN